MTARQKKGVGFLISGLVFVLAGFVFIKFAQTPDWVSVLISAVGGAAGAVGVTLSLPSTTE
jgi:hypothetical protein